MVGCLRNPPRQDLQEGNSPVFLHRLFRFPLQSSVSAGNRDSGNPILHLQPASTVEALETETSAEKSIAMSGTVTRLYDFRARQGVNQSRGRPTHAGLIRLDKFRSSSSRQLVADFY
jgi:hypothetical protein